MTSLIRIDAGNARQILEQAVRTHAQVVLESPAWGHKTLNGFLVSSDEAVLFVEITGLQALAAHQLENTRCEVSLYTERRHTFSTTITAGPSGVNSHCLAIARPQIICAVDRRRFLRARLAPSSRVRLEWTNAAGLQRQVAAMLNISAEGLACRIETAAITGLESGASIRARFSLPAMPGELDLTATVCNTTPASEGHTIMGLHFQPTPQTADVLGALAEVLRHPPAVTAATEVCV